MRIYAEPDDLVPDWVSTPPANAKALIRAASIMVERATRLDRYDVDKDGYPTEPAVKAAFRDACLSQVALWHTAGLNPAGGVVGQAPQITSQSVPGGSVSYAQPLGAEQLGQAATTLSAEALNILRSAGLGRTEVVII